MRIISHGCPILLVCMPVANITIHAESKHAVRMMLILFSKGDLRLTHLKWHTSAHESPMEGLHSSYIPPAALQSSDVITHPTLKCGDQYPPFSAHCIFPNSGIIVTDAIMTEKTNAITIMKNVLCLNGTLSDSPDHKIVPTVSMRN